MYPFDDRWLVCLACTVILAGCGGSKDSDRPETVPVTGTVTYRGQAVEGATVTFMAQSSEGQGAVGKTDESGRFELMTFEPGDGAIPGSYRVKIVKTVTEGVSEEQAQALEEQGRPVPPARLTTLLPTKYADPNTSRLTADVKEDGENDFPFELTD